MSKYCPNCGNVLPDNAKFCLNCGYKLDSQNNSFTNKEEESLNNQNIFKNGQIFLILIFLVIIIGGGIILTSTGDSSEKKVENVTLSITNVGGSGSESFSLYTEALFEHVPSNLEGYNIKTSYYDDNNKLIGSENEKLKSVYYDTDYSISFGFYNTYKKPNPKYVTVEIIKDGSTVNEYKYDIDKTKIDFLN
ncbi:zinc ribbon domain-containing protein [uncultured Methanobrevibacter sp.]|uniref:zinc ribbon domain-containing protein n=1 Tax=uncultured Methanobrevibacter sp. TaxID=253161 RepID=UPI003418F32F